MPDALRHFSVPRAVARPPFHAEPKACDGADPDLFHPQPENASNSEPAKRVCRTCRIEQVCLEWALETHQAFGVWGATTARQRADILRARGELASRRGAA